MLFLPLLLLLPRADALIRLQWSALYDEVDFKGFDQITTDICAAGCKVYATIPITDENKRITSNIIVENPNTKVRTSVADLSRLFMQDSQEKAYLEIGNAPTVTIRNTNANGESAPLALWIVSTNSPYFRTAEVYEPLNLIRPKAVAPVPITVLSAYSFTATVMPGDVNGVYARAAGYDVIDRNAADDCYVVMDNDFGKSFNGIFLAINGPLLTLAFNNVRYPHSEIVLSATTPFSFDQTMSSNPPTFISSPGFMCGNAAHQVHRSSAFNTGNAYTLRTQNDKEMMFNFDIVMDTDGAHPVSIYDQKGAQNHPFSGNFRDRTNEGIFKMQTYRATVSFTPGTADGFYGMRVWADDVGGEDTKTTTSGKDTTTSSTGNPSILILLLAIVAAMFV